MAALSVVIPYVNEYPQVLFTVQALLCELRGVDAEILCVDNGSTDRGRERLDELAALHNGRLRSLHYGARLSHWQAKNHAARQAAGEMLLFLDAHCLVEPGVVRAMLADYPGDGTLHLPIRYLLDRDGADLMYEPVIDWPAGVFHYRFTRCPPLDAPLRVPVMSTCGMLMPAALYARIGGWPAELGIYGGGENYLCGALHVLDVPLRVYHRPCVYHYAERRGYQWDYDDWLRNRAIGAFVPFGADFAARFLAGAKGRPDVKDRILADVVASCAAHRRHLLGETPAAEETRP